MTIETFEVEGFIPALHAMRNPMDSWLKSDSKMIEPEDFLTSDIDYIIGPRDMELSQKLQKAGPEHAKHLRMIQVWADIDAPRYWWNEFDTYRNGVEKLSCSTMHTITKKSFTAESFEHDDNEMGLTAAKLNANEMNTWREIYMHAAEDPEEQKEIWRMMIQNLPQSFLQRRTVMMSYAALRNIVRQRAGHKLKEWAKFIDWVHTLPYADQLIFDKPGDSNAV